MKKLKILWVEDVAGYAESLKFRMDDDLKKIGFEFTVDPHQNGNNVSITVRDWEPDIILVDFNLEEISKNGDWVIREIRFQQHETPIIFYSSVMDSTIQNLVSGEHNVFPTHRDDLINEIFRLLESSFTE